MIFDSTFVAYEIGGPLEMGCLVDFRDNYGVEV